MSLDQFIRDMGILPAPKPPEPPRPDPRLSKGIYYPDGNIPH